MRWMTYWVVAASLALVEPALAADKAVEFSLRDVNGKEVTLASLSGKVVIMSFWATWCAPCKEEMPHLQKLFSAKGADGLVVLSISTDDARTASKVKPYVEKMGYTFPVLLDKESKVIGSYNPAKTLPYTVIVDRKGDVVKQIAGYNPGDEKVLEELVVGLLAAAP